MFDPFRFLIVGGLFLIGQSLMGCFPTQAGPELQHFHQQAPGLGVLAPVFRAVTLEGHPVALADFTGERPVVVQFGSYSCPVFRYREREMRQVYEEFKEVAHFLVVYTVEAHPVGTPGPYRDEEWVTWINWITNVLIPQPTTLDARRAQAAQSRDALNIRRTVWVDGVDNAVWEQYGSAPSSAFVLNSSGAVVLRQVWVDPESIRDRLVTLLGNGEGNRKGVTLSKCIGG